MTRYSLLVALLALGLASCPEGRGRAGDDDDSDDSGDDDSAGDDDSSPVDDDDLIDDDDVAEPILITTDDLVHDLVRIDPETGLGTVAVALDEATIDSTIFIRDGTLYGNASFPGDPGGRLVVIDPCSGSVMSVGPEGYGLTGAEIPGLAVDDQDVIHGIDRANDVLVRIDRHTGVAEEVGPLGVDVHKTGLTWDPGGERFLAINNLDDTLYSIDPATGAAEVVAVLSVDFNNIGIELDPVSGVLFAAHGADLVSIDVSTGEVSVVGGPIHEQTNINDLGAAFGSITCL